MFILAITFLNKYISGEKTSDLIAHEVLSEC